MSVAEASRNRLARVVAGLGLARGAVLGGDGSRARSLLRSALRLAVEAGYGIGAIDALEALSVLLAADDPSPAAPLLLAVDAERARTGYARFPVDEPAHRRAAGSVREVLGVSPDAPALSFDDAVVLALGDGRLARPPSGWASLTPAELRVVELVAEGLTNPEIGERLFISRRTVQVHLSHVFAKLGVGSRTELAAFRRGRPPSS